MHRCRRAILIARRRLTLRRGLSLQSRAAAIGLLGAIAIVLADRLFAAPGITPALIAVAGLTLGLPWLAAVVTRPGRMSTAILLDDRFELKDRVATALHVTRHPVGPIGTLIVDDAERAVESIDVADRFPIGIDRYWRWTPLLAGLLVAVSLIVQPMDLLGLAEARELEDLERRRALIAEQQLQRVLEEINRATSTGLVDDPRITQWRQELRSLAGVDMTEDEARQRAAVAVSNIQQLISQERAQREELLALMLAAVSRIEAAGPETRAMVAALREGDTARALQLLKERVSDPGSLNDGEVTALSEQLGSVAGQLRQQADQAGQASNTLTENIRRALASTGLSRREVEEQMQAIDRTVREGIDLSATQTRTLRDRLETAGLTERQADEVVEQIKRTQSQLRHREKVRTWTRSLAQTLQTASQLVGADRASRPDPGVDLLMAAGEDDRTSRGDAATAEGSVGQFVDAQMSDLTNPNLGKAQREMLEATEARMLAATAMLGGSALADFGGGGQVRPAARDFAIGGGPGIGGARGGSPLGSSRALEGFNTFSRSAATESEGRIVAQWISRGEVGMGESDQPYDQAIIAARRAMERAVSDDRVPRRYHPTLRRYFQTIPGTLDQLNQPERSSRVDAP